MSTNRSLAPLSGNLPALRWTTGDVHSGRFRLMLYRFLSDSIPAVSACIWTWSRLTAAPGRFVIPDDSDSAATEAAAHRLKVLSDRLAVNSLGQPRSLSMLLPDLATALFRDGAFAGFLTVKPDRSGIDRFIPVDTARLVRRADRTIALDTDQGLLSLNRPDFYFLPLGETMTEPFGRSLLSAVPFVSYIEQQLVDDMRRSSHNSGFHRLHVKVTPPERIAGESDQAYTDRINAYFDSTVDMIRSCEIDDNPVTWNNIQIDYIGPDKSREVSNSWFMNHRAMIEEICAGTNLAPFLLGYSYGATTSWSGFKFDVVMRQVRSIQAELTTFLEWLGNLELALGGFSQRCRWVFDNTLSYRAGEEASVRTSQVDNLLKLFQAGLIDETTARQKAGDLL